MITVVTDNLDRHTILSYSVYGGDVYGKNHSYRNVLCKEFDDNKRSHQYKRNHHSFILSRSGYTLNSLYVLCKTSGYLACPACGFIPLVANFAFCWLERCLFNEQIKALLAGNKLKDRQQSSW